VCIFQSLDTLDNGKPVKDAVGDVNTAVRVLRYFAGLTDKVVGQTVPAGNSELGFFCIVYCFWNYTPVNFKIQEPSCR